MTFIKRRNRYLNESRNSQQIQRRLPLMQDYGDRHLVVEVQPENGESLQPGRGGSQENRISSWFLSPPYSRACGKMGAIGANKSTQDCSAPDRMATSLEIMTETPLSS